MNNYELVRRIARFRPLLITESELIGYRKGKIVALSLPTLKKKTICKLKLPLWKKLAMQIRIIERTLRLEPRVAAFVNEDEFIFSFHGCIYCVNKTTGSCKVEHRFIRGMNNPLYFSSIQNVQGFDNVVVYGEYSRNADGGPVGIYGRYENEWKELYAFEPHTVKHIHNIIPDPEKGCVYILTGDADSESGIWIAKDNFRDVSPLLTGKQMYRSCCGYPDEKGIAIVSDNPYETNYLRYVNTSQTPFAVEDVLEINGTCIYGCRVDNDLIFSTAVEPDYTKKHKNRLASMLDRSIGKGIKSLHSVVYKGNISEGFREIARFEKDFWPLGLCAFGSVQFPVGEKNGYICMYSVALKKADGVTLLYRRVKP